jgi:KRAB domain-containing zinc finger protein
MTDAAEEIEYPRTNLEIKVEIKTEEDLTSKTGGFTCPECSENFALAVHFVEHIGEYHSKAKCAESAYSNCDGNLKSFSCSKCSYETLKKSDFRRHVKVHSLALRSLQNATDKPFKCSECSYATRHKGDLNVHQRIHSDEKPFICSECSFATKRKGSLTEHQRIHSNERLFKCSECSYVARQRSSLRRHHRKYINGHPL